MAGRQTVIGRMLAGIDAEIAQHEAAIEIWNRLGGDDAIHEHVTRLMERRGFIANYEKPNGATATPRKPRTKKPKAAKE